MHRITYLRNANLIWRIGASAGSLPRPKYRIWKGSKQYMKRMIVNLLAACLLVLIVIVFKLNVAKALKLGEE